jgi:hypothetical protein
MRGAGILLVGVLALAVTLVIAAVITALAPYVAATIVVTTVIWWVFSKDERDPDESRQLTKED